VSRVLAAALLGVEGLAVEVEVRISSQLPRMDIVGLADAAVRESDARVRAAIASAGFSFPDRRVTVNLAPAHLRKSDPGLDLPIAIGVLAASGAVEPDALERSGFVAELALDGRLRPVRGALALCLALRDAGCARVIVARGNEREAALAPGVDVLVAAELGAVVAHLAGAEPLAPAAAPQRPPGGARAPELADVRGQDHAKRALEIACAGGHALFLRGAPGCGKTMLARRVPALLPALDFDEALEVARIHGAAGRLAGDVALVWERPFRAPHHTASPAGLLGGGNPPRPGEISLAHHGVLFLDELPEFDRRALEALRQVLEEQRITIARARTSCVFPARFQLVAAANPCPCGWLGSGARDCRCHDAALARYAGRLSGPLLDRFDLQAELQPVAWSALDAPASTPRSDEVRARVEGARRRQAERSRGRWSTNAEIPDAELDVAVAAAAEARALLGRAVERLGLSARAARRTLRVARTIADLAGEPHTPPGAVAEALGYRDRLARGNA
jgi:magnesium chelatase family protein